MLNPLTSSPYHLLVAPQPPPVGHSQTPLDLPTAKAAVLQIGDLVQMIFSPQFGNLFSLSEI